jgi:hypothetical protein
MRNSEGREKKGEQGGRIEAVKLGRWEAMEFGLGAYAYVPASGS